MPTPLWDVSYSPSEASRGVFVPLDMSTTTYPATGRGKYAQIVYDVGGAGSVGQPPLSAVIVSPITLNGVISADLIEVDNLWFTTPVSAHVTHVDLSNAIINNSQVIVAGTSAVVVFSPVVQYIEIYNKNSNDTLQLSYDVTDTFNDVVVWGLPIEGETYYAMERDVTSLILTNNTSNPISATIFGHYRG